MLKTLNIQDIHLSVQHLVSKTQWPRYRIRNINTLEDYCVYSVSTYCGNGVPQWFRAIRLDDSRGAETELKGDFAKFTLLSTYEEICYFASISSINFPGEVLKWYQNLSFEFGEG